MALHPPHHPSTITFNRVPTIAMNHTSTLLNPSTNGPTPPSSCLLDFSIQTPPPTPIHPHTKRPRYHHPLNSVSTGLQLAFSRHPNNDLAAHLWQQTAELEQMLRAQGDQLTAAMADRRRRLWTEAAAAAEEYLVLRLKQKEIEIEKALAVNAELQAGVDRLSTETKQWRVRAKEQETAAAALQARLRCAGAAVGGGDAAAEDAESACVEEEEGEVVKEIPLCKICGRNEASIVILPCRHLCLCKECSVSACPSCFSPRRGSVEVFFS